MRRPRRLKGCVRNFKMIGTVQSIIGKAAQREEGKIYHVGLVLAVPEPINGLFPTGNGVGRNLLCQFLRAALAGRGVKVMEAGAAGEFNMSVYILEVDRLAKALEAIHAAVEEAGLAAAAQVAWHDERELLWRWDGNNQGMNFEFWLESIRVLRRVKNGGANT